MSDLPDDHRAAAPSTPNGSADGRAVPVEDPPPPTEDPSTRTHAAGEPDTLPPTWCKKCQAEVTPYGKGRCPRCHAFLKLNFVARRHPVNKLRKQQILDKLVADYRPRTTLMHSTCEHLAGALEQLESLKSGTVEWQRLTQTAQLLGAKLEESRSAVPSPAIELGTLNTKQLIAKTSEILHRLLERQAVENTRHAPIGPAAASAPEEEADSQPEAPAPEPVICKYCRRPCVGPSHPAYDVLHWDAPEQTQKRIDRRNRIEAATAGRPLPSWYSR